jgi:hypothetical protein
MPYLNIGPSHPMGMQQIPTSKNTTPNRPRNPGRKSNTPYTIPEKHMTLKRKVTETYIA